MGVVGVDRLMVINKVSIIQPLPISYQAQIQRIPGVKYVTAQTWFGGIYQDAKNFFPSFAIDPDTQREVFPSWPFQTTSGRSSWATARAPS